VTQDRFPALRLAQADALLGKGMPQCFMAIHGLRLQEERFLSPMKRV